MKLWKIIFSPTGGTERAASMIASAWAGETALIDLTLREENFSRSFGREDVCLVAVPSFGGRVPATAVERLREMEGNGAAAVMVAVYGNRAYDDTLLELEDVLTERGFRCPAAVAAVAEHSIMRRYAAGRPDEEDRAELTGYGSRIRALMEEGGLSERVQVPGNREYREYHGVPFKPKAGKACTGCGLCAVKCPVGAIPKENPAKLREAECISCMRCVSLCPNHARDLNRAMLFAASQKMKKELGGRKKNELHV